MVWCGDLMRSSNAMSTKLCEGKWNEKSPGVKVAKKNQNIQRAYIVSTRLHHTHAWEISQSGDAVAKHPRVLFLSKGKGLSLCQQRHTTWTTSTLNFRLFWRYSHALLFVTRTHAIRNSLTQQRSPSQPSFHLKTQRYNDHTPWTIYRIPNHPTYATTTNSSNLQNPNSIQVF